MSDTPGGPEPVPQPPLRLDETSTLIGRIAMVATFAAIFALVAVFAKPIWQGAQAMLDAVFPSSQSSKSNQLANGAAIVAPAKIATAGPELPAPQPPARAPATTASVPALTTGQASNSPPPATMQPLASPPVQQQAALATDSQSSAPAPAPEAKRVYVRGITDSEIRFGISAPFSGAAKELGQNMKLGIEAAFAVANANGGVYGRKLRLIAADDGYEPKRTADTMKQLFEKDQVFGIVGNVGTPTATVALPYSLERKMLFFGAFTGAGLLRSDPPDRYVFNYRASYMEETDAVVQYLVKVKRLKTNQIAVFAQQDAYGDAGFAGVAKAVRALGGDDSAILRLNYQRNTVDVDAAVEDLKKHRIPIRAVIMVPAYRAAAKFIEKTRDLYPNMIYTSVSFVGSTALANELMLLGPRFANGVIVTQVVPAVDGHSSLVLDYKNALAKYFPGESPDYVSLEGYVAANVLIAALRRNGPDLDTEKLIATLENLRDLDLGLGTPVTFGRSEHQGVHKVWGSQLDATGHYQALDLQ
ncbi:MAG TPA: ABC transporter substrate-binding protein [Pseudolabrys sp.]|nr:ABC transporter substrate-binding protein [Pseudolabrys sp.]